MMEVQDLIAILQTLDGTMKVNVFVDNSGELYATDNIPEDVNWNVVSIGIRV